MTEEEFNAKIQEAREAAQKEAAEAIEAARLEAEKVRSDLEGVVSELKEERAKKNEALEKAQLNNPKTEATPGTPDISQAIQAEIDRREAEKAKREMEEAVQEFKNSKTEFQADKTGMVFERFQKELSRFNFSDVNSKEKAKQRLEEAYRFVKQTSPDAFGEPTHEGTPSSPAPVKDQGGRLDPTVSQTLEETGVSEERYRHLESKYGDALASLGFGK